MHATANSFYLTVFFALLADAQITTGSATTRSGVVTSYFSVCPTASNTANASITAAPVPVTVTGDDGRTTIYRTETTILPHMCPDNNGVCGATYTLSEQCPCEKPQPKTVWEEQCPQGFTTTVVACKACEQNGGPATVTIVTPLPEGPYATVTPAYGQPAANPSDITPNPVDAPTPEQTQGPAAPGGNPDNSGNNGNPPSSASTAPASNQVPGSETENKSAPENDMSANPDNGAGEGATESDNGNGNGNGNVNAPINLQSNAPGAEGSNTTKPYIPKPYTGSATGRTNSCLGGMVSLISTVVIGSLALVL